jgi:hypothetical protein
MLHAEVFIVYDLQLTSFGKAFSRKKKNDGTESDTSSIYADASLTTVASAGLSHAQIAPTTPARNMAGNAS